MSVNRLLTLLALAAAACAGPAPSRAPAGAPSVTTASGTPSAANAPALVPDPPPPTPARPVVDVYHGVEVRDPYRWLEDGASPEVKAWDVAQDARARKYLAALPGRDAIAREVEQLMTAKVIRWSSLTWRPGRLFALRRLPGRQQPALVVLPSVDEPDAAKVVVDPVALDPSGATTIDFYRPSPDGRLVAVSLSRAGTESGDLHFFSVETGERVDAIIPRVNGGTAGGDVAWAADGSGVFYTRYPREGERPPEDLDFFVEVWFHRLGTGLDRDRYELGREGFPRTAEIALFTQERTGRVLALVQEGDSGRFRHWLRERDGRWTRFTDWADEIGFAVFGEGDDLYLLSRKNAPRGQILRVSLPNPRLDRARVIVPEGEDTIDWTFAFGGEPVVTAGRMYVVYQLGGPTELRAFTLDGKPLPPLGIPTGSTVGAPKKYTNGQVLFGQTSFTDPPGFWRVAPGAPAVRTPLATKHPADFSDAETRREWAVSKDGTRIPITIVLRKGTKLDGTNPLLATGYGGYGISQTPHFDATLRVWLDRGGIQAFVHARGGGEFGREWHHAGRGLHKQNTFDDFAAALRHLVARGYTSPSRIAIEGGSNGGILMGAMITQFPELQAVAVTHVGVYDMLRNETTKNGQFNVPEYGSVTVPEEFRVLHAYSPYHRVRSGTRYPAVLILAGVNDPRVDVWHSRKFAAALQAATASNEPVLLRLEFEGGHGIGAALAQRIGMAADVYAFLLHELGVTGRKDAPETALPVVRSNVPVIAIRDGARLKRDYWTLSPDVPLDVYEAELVDGVPHDVTFITDVEEITFRVEEGSHHDFVVRWNERDCRTRIVGTHFVPPARFDAAYREAHRGRITIEVPEVYELVNVALAMTPTGLADPSLVHKSSDYYARVRAWFDAYRDHPLLAAFDAELRKSLLAYFELKMNAYAFEFDTEGRIVPSRMYDRTGWEKTNALRPHLAALQSFADATRFREFYRRNRSTYEEQIAFYRDQADVPGMKRWLDHHFPSSSDYDVQKVVFSPLVGGYQSSIAVESDGFKELHAHVNFPWPERVARLAAEHGLSAKAQTVFRGNIVFTELNHGYIDPEGDRYRARIANAVRDRDHWVDPAEGPDYYPGPAAFLEYLNWGLVSLRIVDALPEAEQRPLIASIEEMMTQRRGFPRFAEFNAFLVDLYRRRKPGQTLAELYPRIIQWFEERGTPTAANR